MSESVIDVSELTRRFGGKRALGATRGASGREAMDPLEWLARVADQIPDTGKHRTYFYRFYASRVRGSRRETEASDAPAEATTKRR